MCAHIYVQFRILMGPKWFPPGLYAPFMDLVFLLFLSLILTPPCYNFQGLFSLFLFLFCMDPATSNFWNHFLLSKTYNFFQIFLCIDPVFIWNLYVTYVYSTDSSKWQSRLLPLFQPSHYLSEKKNLMRSSYNKHLFGRPFCRNRP